MPLSRLLLPIVVAVALIGHSVVTFAAAGFERVATCCCPDPDTCKCHDHEREPGGAPQMTRCGQRAELHAPQVLVAILPVAAPVIEAVLLTPPALPEPAAMPDDRTIEPMVPPF